MANTCSTVVNIYPSNKEDIEKVFEFFKKNKLKYSTPVEHYLNRCGISLAEYDCIGYVQEIEDKGQFVLVYLESNWQPYLQWIYAICNKLIGDNNYQIFWTAEEEGCELYWSNDPEIVGTVILNMKEMPDEIMLKKICDAFKGEIDEGITILKKEMAINGLKDILDSNSDDFNELLIELFNSDYYDYFSLHEYKYKENV